MRTKQPGFTLVEIIVTIGIVAALSTLAIISFRGTRVAARDTKRLSDFNTLATALQTYYQQNGSYPSTLVAGAALQSPDGQTTYLKTIPANPRPRSDNGCPDQNYTYSVTVSNRWFIVSSCLGQGESGSDILTLTPDGLSKTPNAQFSWWAFDEGDGTTISDGGNLDAILSLSGGTSWEPTENCKKGTCLTLDGDSGYGSFPIPTLPRYTVMTWVKRLSDQATDPEKFEEFQIFATPDDKVGLTVKYYSPSNTTDTHFVFWDGTITSSTTQADLDTFYHVAITSDGTTKKLYINGVVEASGPATNTITSGTGKIGESYSGGTRRLNATLDDFRFYDRALSAHEITNIYNASH